MLRNTRKRLHQFFRPKNALLQFYLQPTTRSQRARSAPPGYRTSERPLRDAFHRPGQKGPKPASSFRRTYTKFHACFTRRLYFVTGLNSRMPRSDPPAPRPRIHQAVPAPIYLARRRRPRRAVRVSRRLPKRQEQQGQRSPGHFSRFQHNKLGGGVTEAAMSHVGQLRQYAEERDPPRRRVRFCREVISYNVPF